MTLPCNCHHTTGMIISGESAESVLSCPLSLCVLSLSVFLSAGCQYAGKEYPNGADFLHPTNKCKECHCIVSIGKKTRIQICVSLSTVDVKYHSLFQSLSAPPCPIPHPFSQHIHFHFVSPITCNQAPCLHLPTGCCPCL